MGSNKIKEFEHNDTEEKNVINSIIGIKRKHIGLGSVMRQELVEQVCVCVCVCVCMCVCVCVCLCVCVWAC